MCICLLTIIGSFNGLSPSRRQAIIWTNAEILSIGPLKTYHSEIFIDIQILYFIQENAFENVVSKMAAFFLGLNVLTVVVNAFHVKGTEAVIHWCNDKMADTLQTTISNLSYRTKILFFFKSHNRLSKGSNSVNNKAALVQINDCGQTVDKILSESKVAQLADLQYIPRNMHTVLLCFALLWLCNRS